MALVSRFDVPGSELTSLRVGGLCREVIEVFSEADLIDALALRPDAVCIGGGSNLLVADQGFAGTLIRVFSSSGSGITLGEGGAVHVEAPVDWDALVKATVDAGLSGLEATSGIPGSVGGAVVQNAGAYGQEIADVVVQVSAWDRKASQRVVFQRGECGFSYRESRFKHDEDRRFVITSADMKLTPAESNTPRYGDVSELLQSRHGHAGPFGLLQIRDAVLTVRTRKGMVLGASAPSAGSFFTNPAINREQAQMLTAEGIRVIERSDGMVLTSAAALMEAAGFSRGDRFGSAGLSELHVLALVNLGDAKTADIVALARRVRTAVHDRFGIWLRPEPVLLGFDSDPFATSP